MSEPFSNPPLAEIRRLLHDTHSIAVVGLSDNPARPSHRVASYLLAAGYRILPVNPLLETALGLPCRPDLESLGETVDMVCIFRRSEEVPPLVEAAIRLGCRAVWMQDGVAHAEAAQAARAAGLQVVMNDCLLRRHQALLGAPGA
jgi:predicted CoA-binding protein